VTDASFVRRVVVCLEERGRQIRVECWEDGEGAQARLREGLVVA
jgi:hypothetical protein